MTSYDNEVLISNKYLELPQEEQLLYCNLCIRANSKGKVNLNTAHRLQESIITLLEITNGKSLKNKDILSVLEKKNCISISGNTVEIVGVYKEDAIVKNELNSAIELFGNINPSYELLFKRKNQREATKRLLDKYGFEKLEKLVMLASQASGKEYAPTITTPCQLEDKLGSLVSWARKNSPKRSNYDD